MGMRIFETSGSFNPSDHGLAAGDVVDVVCVGGGASGAYLPTAESGHSPSAGGGASSFGSYVSSANGVVMARGGQTRSLEGGTGYASGSGAGGYLPGVPFYGGNGGQPVGLAGSLLSPVSPYCNMGGYGNKGAAGGSDDAWPPAGNGYGAGGSGMGQGTQLPGAGGDAGKIVFGSAVLADSSAVTVTVGAGGTNASDAQTVTGKDSLRGAPGVVIVFW